MAAIGFGLLSMTVTEFRMTQDVFRNALYHKLLIFYFSLYIPIIPKGVMVSALILKFVQLLLL